MLCKEQLELMVKRGCGMPGCTHRECRELFFHPKCHVSYGTRLSYSQPDVLQLNCGHCKQKVLEFSVIEQKPLRPTCHPKAPVWVSYRRGSGKLRVICRLCRKLVTTIPVWDGQTDAAEAITEKGNE